MLRRGLLISIARASRRAGGPGTPLLRLALAGARALPRPDPQSPSDATPLDRLTVTVLDCETTGLDPRRDRIVALAALRFHPVGHPAQASLDTLVDPDMPIPAASTAIHGITDAMVAGAPGFRAAARRLLPLLRGTVLVGHAIGFDRAVLAREARRSGLPWRDTASLCVRELAAALLPASADLALEALADRFGVPLVGRHTAMGDAQAAAGIFAGLQRPAAKAGATTLGGLHRLAEEGRLRLARHRGLSR
jgi:DNA polymerase III epsilon subunit-like protein